MDTKGSTQFTISSHELAHAIDPYSFTCNTLCSLILNKVNEHGEVGHTAIDAAASCIMKMLYRELIVTNLKVKSDKRKGYDFNLSDVFHYPFALDQLRLKLKKALLDRPDRTLCALIQYYDEEE